MAMDIIQTFNQELNSLLEIKLPVSRQKMITLTRTAISDKAMKFYKHIVYSVEKFIRICPDEYKITGLYVIDAIVRQSKQMYQERDVYGPRFLKNIVGIFVILARSNNIEKPMIQRVLQLWSKAGVYSTDLLDLLGQIINNETPELIEKANIISSNNFDDINSKRRITSSISDENSSEFNSSSVNHQVVTLDMDHQSTSQIHTLQKLIEQTKSLSSSHLVEGNDALMDKLHSILNELRMKAQEAILAQKNTNENVDIESIIDSETLGQLQLMITKLAEQIGEESSKSSSPSNNHDAVGNNNRTDHYNKTFISSPNHSGIRPTTPYADDDSNMNESNSRLYQSAKSSVSSPNSLNHKFPQSPNNSNYQNSSKKVYSVLSNNASRMREDKPPPPPPPPPPYPPSVKAENHHPPLPSEPPSETAQQIRRRRVRLNLPELRANHIGILSHTIFVGHLHKTLLEHRLQTLCEEIGEGIVVECNFIPPRGCAFITYESRLAAHKALLALDNACVDNRQVKVAWAPNKGVKESVKLFEKFWSPQEGVTWIPVSYVKDEITKTSFDALLNGNGEFDHDTLPYDHALRSKKGGPIPDYPHKRNSDAVVRKRPASSPSGHELEKKIANGMNSTNIHNPSAIPPPIPMMLSLSVPPPPLVATQPASIGANSQNSLMIPVSQNSLGQMSNTMLMGGFQPAPPPPPGHIPSNRPMFTNAPPPLLPQGNYPGYPRMYGP